jgi:hypothetical protein
MRRFFSWLVFVLLYSIVCKLGGLVTTLAFLFIDWLGDKSTGLLIFLILIGGTLLLGLLFLPFTLGIPAVVMSSESICPSRKGTRYLVWSIINSVTMGIVIIGAIFCLVDFSFELAYEALYVLVFFLTYKKHLGETWS